VPPSFRDPKSVVVVALPPVGPSQPPPLHPVNPSETFCAQKPGLVLPAEGGPLAFGTQLAHDLRLHIDSPHGSFDLPLTAEPAKGGLVISEPLPAIPSGDLAGIVRGKWGFDDWDGPRFNLVSAGSGKWTVAADDQSALVVGRNDTLHIQGDTTLCISGVEEAAADKPLPLTWKAIKPELLVVNMPMKDATPGPLTVEIHQYGVKQADTLSLNAYAEAASLDRLTVNVGDSTAFLKGTRLDEVAKASFGGITWTPAGLARVQDFDQLTLSADKGTSDLEPGSRYSAKVQLRDGRELKVAVKVEPPRPQVTLLSKGTQDDGAAQSPVRLGSADDLPLSSRLVFFLKSEVPQKFPRNENVEVAAEDGSFRTVLSLADGSLMLEDARTALGAVEPLARFGASAFGPVRARAVSADGVPGEWMPLGTLVRLPAFKELRCPHATAKPCTLTATNLFLVDSIASDQGFSNAIEVPADFTGNQITVPHPANGTLYLKLRDDPTTVQTLTLPVTAVTPGPVTAASVAAAAQPQAIAPPAADAPPTAKSEAAPPSKADSAPSTEAQP
jgi:hypothetical protein